MSLLILGVDLAHGVVVVAEEEAVAVEEASRVVMVEKPSVTAMLKPNAVQVRQTLMRFLLAHHSFMLLERALLPSLGLLV